MGFHMVSYNTDHEHGPQMKLDNGLQSPWRQSEPHTSTWIQVAAQTTDVCMTFSSNINTEPSFSRTTDPDITMAPGGSAGYSDQYDLQQQHFPETSTRFQSAAQTLTDLGFIMETTWTTDTSMASDRIMDFGGLSMMSI